MGEELQSDINIIVMDKDGNDLGKVWLLLWILALSQIW